MAGSFGRLVRLLPIRLLRLIVTGHSDDVVLYGIQFLSENVKKFVETAEGRRGQGR